jgi:hypothetical protein
LLKNLATVLTFRTGRHTTKDAILRLYATHLCGAYEVTITCLWSSRLLSCTELLTWNICTFPNDQSLLINHYTNPDEENYGHTPTTTKRSYQGRPNVGLVICICWKKVRDTKTTNTTNNGEDP